MQVPYKYNSILNHNITKLRERSIEVPIKGAAYQPKTDRQLVS